MNAVWARSSTPPPPLELDPPAVDRKTAMPMLGISERGARDMAEYLYTRR